VPRYDYSCPRCEHVEEFARAFPFDLDDENYPVCAFCALKLERVFSVPSITFKGGGWAKSDRNEAGRG
jgi:putative FmdB family regulatory protein